MNITLVFNEKIHCARLPAAQWVYHQPLQVTSFFNPSQFRTLFALTIVICKVNMSRLAFSEWIDRVLQPVDYYGQFRRKPMDKVSTNFCNKTAIVALYRSPEYDWYISQCQQNVHNNIWFHIWTYGTNFIDVTSTLKVGQ